MSEHRLKILKLFLSVVFMAAVLTAPVVWADPGDILWRYQTGGSVSSSPAIGGDGTLYTGNYDNYVYAINPNGSLKWSYQTNDRIYSSPAVGADGTVYIGSYDNFLYAFNSDGTLKWNYEANGKIYASPAIAADGTVYVADLDGYLYAMNPDGTPKWVYPTNGWIASSPAIGADGTVYVGNLDDRLYAIDAEGFLKWKYQTAGWIVSSPAVAIDGTIYVGSHDNYLYALWPSGTPKWRYETGAEIWSSPTIGTDGVVYVGSYDNALYAITSFGDLKWQYETGGEIWSSPAIGADGTIYVGSNDNFLYALDAEGTVRWTYETNGELWTMPAIGSDGTVYVGSADRSLYAIEGDSPWNFNDYASAMGAYADSSWPKFGQNSFSLHRKPEWQMPSLELPSDAVVYPDYTVIVPLTLVNTGIIPVEGLEVEVEFDAAVLEAVRVILKDSVLEEQEYDVSYQKEQGKIIFTISAGEEVFTGEGIIAYLEFHALGDVGNTTALRFTKSDMGLTSVDTTNGAVSIVQLVPPSLALTADVKVYPTYPVTLPLTLTNIGNASIEGIDAEIEFDPEVLSFTGITLADGVLESANYGLYSEPEEGKLVVSIYAIGDLFSDEGEAAYLTFDAIGEAPSSSALTFTKALINETDVNADNGSVEILNAFFNISGKIGYYTDSENQFVRNVQMILEDAGAADEEPGDEEPGDEEPGDEEPEDTGFTATQITGADGAYLFPMFPWEIISPHLPKRMILRD